MNGNWMDFLISIIGLGLVMGVLASTGLFNINAILVLGLGFGLILGGVFRAVQNKSKN